MNYRKILLLSFFFFAFAQVKAQVNPKNGDSINYTSVLISFPAHEAADSYTIELSDEPGFKHKSSFPSPANAHIVNALIFGKKYYWRYQSLDALGRSLGWSEVFQFYIQSSPGTNPELYQYRGKKKDREQVESGVLFMDYGRVAVNRAGKALWFLPDFPFLQENELVRDLKLTPEGTITGLIDSVACEMDLNGRIIWRAPDDGQVSGEGKEYYHHDLKKLPNGHFMVLGMSHDKRKLPDSSDSLNIEFGTIIEYDPEGRVVWSWKSSDYFTDAFIFSRRRADGSYNTQTHMNAFGTDGQYVFAGFRDINTIIAINKASGEVEESYGGTEFSTEPHSATGFFRRQHDALLLKDGNLAVLNNDSIMDPAVVSSLVIFSRITEKNPESRKVFEFKFDFDTLTNGKTVKMGNLQEMSNSDILINMGALNRCIEVSRTGELVWDMFMEKYDTIHGNWTKFPQYRVSFTPSLYPYVFRSKVISDIRHKRTREIEIKLFNVGESDDSYSLGFTDKSGALPCGETTQTIHLDPGESGVIKLTIRQKGPVQIRIESSKSLLFEVINL